MSKAASWLLLVAVSADVYRHHVAAGRAGDAGGERALLSPGEAEAEATGGTQIGDEAVTFDEVLAHRGAAALGLARSGDSGTAHNPGTTPCDVPIYSNTSNSSWPLREAAAQTGCGRQQVTMTNSSNDAAGVLKPDDACNLLRSEVHSLHTQIDKLKVEKATCEAERLDWKTKATRCEDEETLRKSTQEDALDKLTNMEGDYEQKAKHLQAEVDKLMSTLATSEAAKAKRIVELESVVAVLRQTIKEKTAALEMAEANHRKVVADQQKAVSVLDRFKHECEKSLVECTSARQRVEESRETCAAFASAHSDKIKICGDTCAGVRMMEGRSAMCDMPFKQACEASHKPCDDCPCTREVLVSVLCPADCNIVQ